MTHQQPTAHAQTRRSSQGLEGSVLWVTSVPRDPPALSPVPLEPMLTLRVCLCAGPVPRVTTAWPTPPASYPHHALWVSINYSHSS